MRGRWLSRTYMPSRWPSARLAAPARHPRARPVRPHGRLRVSTCRQGGLQRDSRRRPATQGQGGSARMAAFAYQHAVKVAFSASRGAGPPPKGKAGPPAWPHSRTNTPSRWPCGTTAGQTRAASNARKVAFAYQHAVRAAIRSPSPRRPPGLVRPPHPHRTAQPHCGGRRRWGWRSGTRWPAATMSRLRPVLILRCLSPVRRTTPGSALLDKTGDHGAAS
jgi:hypothetical protein